MNSICVAVAMPSAGIHRSFADSRPVQPDHRADESAETLARLAGALDIASLADAGLQQHLFEFAQVRWRERFALPQLVQHDVIFVGFKEMPDLLLEARKVGLADLRQFMFDAVANLVGKIRINHSLSRLFDMLDQISSRAVPIRAAGR